MCRASGPGGTEGLKIGDLRITVKEQLPATTVSVMVRQRKTYLTNHAPCVLGFHVPSRQPPTSPSSQATQTSSGFQKMTFSECNNYAFGYVLPGTLTEAEIVQRALDINSMTTYLLRFVSFLVVW